MRSNYKLEKERPNVKTDPELITYLSRELKCSVPEAANIVAKLVDGVRKSIVTNGYCYLRNLGRFTLKSRKHIRFKHFQGHTIEIPVLYSLRFSSSTSMRILINKKSIDERKAALEKTKNSVS